jgi:hypothetical protein
MDEPRLEELLSRIEILERENRRWKQIGIGALAMLLVFVLVGGLFSIGASLRYVAEVRAVREAALRERDAAEQAHQAALEAEQRARHAADAEAQRRAMQAADAAEQKLKGDKP